MLIFQEFSGKFLLLFFYILGETLYNLSISEDIESLTIWAGLDYVVLVDTVRFDANKVLHFYNMGQHLINCETYLPILKKIHRKYGVKILIEVRDALFADKSSWHAYFGSLWDFVVLHKLDGVKFNFTEITILSRDFVQAFEKHCNRTVEIVVIDLPDIFLNQEGFVHHVVNCADFVLLRAQGYFEKQYLNEVYGQRFLTLVERNDRTLDLIEVGMNNLFAKLGFRRQQILLDIATTSVKFENDGVTKVYEFPRKDSYMDLYAEGLPIDEFRQCHGDGCYFDHHSQIRKKLHKFILDEKLNGVYLQDIKHDLAWNNSRSVLGCCLDFNQTEFVWRLPDMLPRREEILQAPRISQPLQDRTSNPVSRYLQQEDK